MTDHKRDDDGKEELGITDINAIIKNQKTQLEHQERMPDNQIPKLIN